jgi:hypothetical protein
MHVWILGNGRVCVHKQFILDYNRLTLFLDGERMPRFVRDGLLLLLEKTGKDYYAFTKFMTQTIGNISFETLRKLTSDEHLVLKRDTFKVLGTTVPNATVSCTFICDAYNKDLVRTKRYCVKSTVELKTYDLTFHCTI